MDKVCEKLRKVLELIKRDKANFDDGLARYDFNHAKAYRPEIFEKTGKLEFLLTGEKFVNDLVNSHLVRFKFLDKWIPGGEEAIRKKIKVETSKIKIDLGGTGTEGAIVFGGEATYLPDYLDVRGDLVIEASSIAELPQFLNVTGNLTLNDEIKELPDNIRVAKDLNLGSNASQELRDRAHELKGKRRIGGWIN